MRLDIIGLFFTSFLSLGQEASTSGVNDVPVCNAGGPYVSQCPDHTTTLYTVQVDGSASYDPDGDVLTYKWDINNCDGYYDDLFAVEPTMYIELLDTPCQATLVVSDGESSASCEADVILADCNAPIPAPAPAPVPAPSPTSSSSCQCVDKDGNPCQGFSVSSDGTTGICSGGRDGCYDATITGCEHVECHGYLSCFSTVVTTKDVPGSSIKCIGDNSCQKSSRRGDVELRAERVECGPEPEACKAAYIFAQDVFCNGKESCYAAKIDANSVDCSGNQSCSGYVTSITSQCLKCSGDPACVSCDWEPLGDSLGPIPCADAPAECATSGKEGGAFDDPHIKTFGGVWFDYMSKCDLVLLAVEGFLEIFIRTETRFDYSYIESAVVRIGGEDTILVSGFGQYILRDVSNGDLQAGINGYPISHSKVSEKLHLFEIDLGDGESIKVRTFNDMVSVKIHANNGSARFHSARGLMGEYPSGRKLNRAGNITLEDPNDFGAEWQVRDDEPMLFPVTRSPQYPEACTPPKFDSSKQRRLGELAVTLEMAKDACSSWNDDMKQFCIHDVLSTQDVELAKTGASW